MPNWLLPLYIVLGLGSFPVFLLVKRNNPEARAKMDRRLLFLASVLFAFGFGTLVWAFQISGSMPVTAREPACWLVGVLFVCSWLTTNMTGLGLFIAGSNKEWLRMPRRDAFIFSIPPAVLLLAICVLPLLKIPQGSLVAENGRILQFGTSYGFRPGHATAKVGLNNPIEVTVSKTVNSAYYGKCEMWFTAKVELRLKPGDRLASNFRWYEFQNAVTKWFAGRLDNRFDIEPRWTSKEINGVLIAQTSENTRSIGSVENDRLMQVPVSWSGTYTFRER